MLPICDPHGSTIAWFKDELIFSLSGTPLAFLKDESVINYAGTHCGFLKNGFFRDYGGNIVAFMRGATGGPILPPVKVAPAPIPGVIPIRPAAPIPPAAAMPTFSWSRVPWDAFIMAIRKPPAPPKIDPPVT